MRYRSRSDRASWLCGGRYFSSGAETRERTRQASRQDGETALDAAGRDAELGYSDTRMEKLVALQIAIEVVDRAIAEEVAMASASDPGSAPQDFGYRWKRAVAGVPFLAD